MRLLLWMGEGGEDVKGGRLIGDAFAGDQIPFLSARLVGSVFRWSSLPLEFLLCSCTLHWKCTWYAKREQVMVSYTFTVQF